MPAAAFEYPRLYAVILPLLAGMRQIHRHSRAAALLVGAACWSQADALILGRAVCAPFNDPSMLGLLPVDVLAVHGTVHASAC